jgi:LPXTG-site transpeptidase (sortase) family protein
MSLTPRHLAAAVLVAVGLAVMGWALLRSGSTSEAAPAAEVSPSATPTSVAPSPTRKAETVGHRPTRPDPDAGVPTRLLVPSLRVDAPVVRIGVTNGTLIPPDDPQVLGWWSDGAPPGAKTGGALITGHTVHTGGGAMDDLETLTHGDPITVRTVEGNVDYTVNKVKVYRKATLAQDAATIFSQERPSRLVLITCEDWDGTKYLSNVVVLGHPV